MVDLQNKYTITFGNIITSVYNGRVEHGSFIVIPQSPNMFVPVVNTSLNIMMWSFFASQFGMVSIQVWRKVQTQAYTLLGQTLHYAMNIGIQISYPNEIIHVQPGDVFGFYAPNDVVFAYQCRTSRECEGHVNQCVKWENEQDINTGVTYGTTQSDDGVYCQCRQYPVQAKLQRTFSTIS